MVSVATSAATAVVVVVEIFDDSGTLVQRGFTRSRFGENPAQPRAAEPPPDRPKVDLRILHFTIPAGNEPSLELVSGRLEFGRGLPIVDDDAVDQ